MNCWVGVKQNQQGVMEEKEEGDGRRQGGEQSIRCVLIEHTFVGEGVVKVRHALREPISRHLSALPRKSGTCESKPLTLQTPYKTNT